ncbi:peroxiredoxin-like family protein [Amycolatopsis rhabdoformis]|uniref:thioredoxin-dependent peroxiredoxin n=1 Tax=Amycolatopsis rhabdoformis TaxID=1448059 RepID=A0ABZ1I7U4_9PSEU|nr:peroxiredoxin-like family protein [Amycolatopsis rhabdoformis]WSE29943.1 peroxiredoxin-like family protein [Amycolatopsis rhabdoformis]
MALEHELAAQRQRAYELRSERERAVRADAVTAVVESRLAERALREGESIPGIRLPDATGKIVDVGALLAEGAVVLSFYRGGWCPYCNLELRALQARLPDLRALGAGLVAISPELPDRSLSTVEKNELGFPVLSDVGNDVARQFRLVHPIAPDVVRYQLGNGNDVAAFNGSDVAEVPLPATYVVDRLGVVRFAFVAADYTRRAEPAELLAAVRELAGEHAGDEKGDNDGGH